MDRIDYLSKDFLDGYNEGYEGQPADEQRITNANYWDGWLTGDAERLGLKND